MRVICPSAKITTTSPCLMASRASSSALIMSRGRSCAEIGMARMALAKSLCFCMKYFVSVRPICHGPQGSLPMFQNFT